MKGSIENQGIGAGTIEATVLPSAPDYVNQWVSVEEDSTVSEATPPTQHEKYALSTRALLESRQQTERQSIEDRIKERSRQRTALLAALARCDEGLDEDYQLQAEVVHQIHPEQIAEHERLLQMLSQVESAIMDLDAEGPLSEYEELRKRLEGIYIVNDLGNEDPSMYVDSLAGFEGEITALGTEIQEHRLNRKTLLETYLNGRDELEAMLGEKRDIRAAESGGEDYVSSRPVKAPLDPALSRGFEELRNRIADTESRIALCEMKLSGYIQYNQALPAVRAARDELEVAKKEAADLLAKQDKLHEMIDSLVGRLNEGEADDLSASAPQLGLVSDDEPNSSAAGLQVSPPRVTANRRKLRVV